MFTYVSKVPPKIAKRGKAIAKALRAGIPLQGNHPRLTEDRPERIATMGDMVNFLAQKKKDILNLDCSPSVLASFNEFADAAVLSIQDEAQVAASNDLRELARQGDATAKMKLAANIKRITMMLLLPTAEWLPFLQTNTLADNERPLLKTGVEQETSVRVLGPDGGLKEFGSVQELDNFLVPLYFLTSDWFAYALTDLYQGSDVKNTALATIDIARDLAMHIDSLVRSYHLPGATDTIITGTFVTEGSPSELHYLVHSNVVKANLPTGNYIELDDNSGTSKLRKAIFKAIVAYTTAWGKGSFKNGPDMQAVAIHVPSSEASDFLNDAELASTTDGKREEIVNNPFTISYGGQTFTIVPDASLDPSLECVIVRMNRPTGVFYTKPSVGRQITDNSAVLQSMNKERVMETKAIGMHFPLSWAVNVLCIRYREA